MVKKVININGLNIYYIDVCDIDNPIETIVFLNGWSGSSLSWTKNIEELRKYYRCIAIDFPGFGISDEPQTIWNILDYADFLNSFIPLLGVKKFNLVGKSFGGRVAILYATHYSHNLNKLSLVASAGLEHKSIIVKLKILLFKIGKSFSKLFSDPAINRFRKILFPLFKIPTDTSEYRRMVRALVTKYNLKSDITEISVPTIIIWGSNDHILPVEQGVQMQKLISRSSLSVIDDAGHNAHETHYEEFNKLIMLILGIL